MSPLPGARRSTVSVCGAVLDALDQVLEDGVPRRAVAQASGDVLAQWEWTWARADAVITQLRARWPRVPASDPGLLSLVGLARSVVALARSVGLAEAIDTGQYPALAALEARLADALAYAEAACHEELRAALTGSAA